jgi:hypothetical protein
MPITFATSSRGLVAAMLASTVVAFFPGCGDQSVERKGGGDIPDLNAGTVSIVGGGQSSGSGAAGVAGAI